ncbi:MAG: alpha/beta hydrolase [Candidatus Abawacabacteria bacterium]|nr:alpha/beta hydrolase [Candidatus Abawacabacteria bacterium]
MTGEIVQVRTQDDLILSGLYSYGEKGKPLIIHIHGYSGTFYTNKFIHVIAEQLAQRGMGFLTVETRGSYEKHDLPAYGKGYSEYGGFLELLEEAYQDIDAWISFALKQGCQNIVLQGHSLGTYKIIRYLFEGKKAGNVKKLILLCPFDKQGIIEKASQGKWPEYLHQAKENMAQGNGQDMIPTTWGSVPLSYQTFVSWYQENELNKIFDLYQPNYHSSVLAQVTLPVKLIVGDKDEILFAGDPNPAFTLERIRSQFPHGEAQLIAGARHSFRDCEQEVAASVTQFVNT